MTDIKREKTNFAEYLLSVGNKLDKFIHVVLTITALRSLSPNLFFLFTFVVVVVVVVVDFMKEQIYQRFRSLN